MSVRPSRSAEPPPCSGLIYAGVPTHYAVEQPVGLARIVEREDVGVGKASHDLDLAEETFRDHIQADLRMHDLDGDLAMVLQILSKEDGRHTTTADLRLDGVPIRKC